MITITLHFFTLVNAGAFAVKNPKILNNLADAKH
jgi:hypothetical protein